MVGGRRYSFDEALNRRLKELEATLESHHDAIAADAQRWLADIERAATLQLEVLEASVADKTAELQWVAAEQRRALDQAAGALSVEVVDLARPGLSATKSDAAGDRRIEDFREAVRAQMALLEELTSLHAAASELENARAVTVDALRRSMEALGRDILAAVVQARAVEREDAAGPARDIEHEARSRPVYWSAPPEDGLWE